MTGRGRIDRVQVSHSLRKAIKVKVYALNRILFFRITRIQ